MLIIIQRTNETRYTHVITGALIGSGEGFADEPIDSLHQFRDCFISRPPAGAKFSLMHSC